VLVMGKDAEGPLVDLGVLFTLLRCDCSLVLLDRRYDLCHLHIISPPSFSSTPHTYIHTYTALHI
jgi:hypothetical protein